VRHGVDGGDEHVEDDAVDRRSGDHPRRDHRGSLPGRVALVAALLAGAIGAITATTGQERALAQQARCERYQGGHRHVVVGAGCGDQPTSTTVVRSVPDPWRPSDRTDPPPCPRWQFMGTSSGDDVDGDGLTDFPVAPHLRPSFWEDAPVGSSFYYDTCTSPNGFAPGASTMWVPPGGAAPVPPPSPEEVAEGLWVDVRETLLRPAVEASPEVGEPTVLDVATFVLVTNWQGEIFRERCESGVCIELSATPSLLFDPGEPGAAAVECDPPGTRFDPSPSAPSPDDQADVPGACAHRYQHRTGVRGSPEAWPGEVRVAWDVQWVEAGGDESGAFDVTLSTDVPRPVDEVGTVVVDVD
jgi:hypothetical protein